MTETRREEHARLQKRTSELRQEHAALSRDKTPFNQSDHDRHAGHLRRHRKDLADHMARGKDEPSR